jgi:predicted phosphodiesterase
MRIALLADIHGNSAALDAVLTDIHAGGGVDAYWVLGDLVALGPDPIGVLARLTTLPNVRFIRGNTDRYVVTGDRPPPTLADAAADPKRLYALVEVAGTFAWTQGALTVGGWLGWLANLPLEFHEQLPDGTNVLCVHAAPGTDDGWGLPPTLSDEGLAAHLSPCQADLICVGHTHHFVDRRLGQWHLVNPGSLSNPPTAERRASYVLLKATVNGYSIEQRLVDYNRMAVIASLKQLRHPGAAFVIRLLGG